MEVRPGSATPRTDPTPLMEEAATPELESAAAPATVPVPEPRAWKKAPPVVAPSMS